MRKLRIEAGRAAATFALAIVVSVSPRALAVPDASAQTAKTLYQSGLTDYNLGHYETALGAFEQAYRVRRDPAFLFNIGQCQRQLRKYEEAEQSYRAYLRESVDVTVASREQVQKLIADMRRAIEARTIAESAKHQEAPATAKPAPPTWAVSPSDRESGRKKIIAGLAVAAFGVVAIGVGGGFYAVAQSANRSVNTPADGTFSASAEDRRNMFQSLDIAAFVVGGAAVAAGGTVAILGWRQRHRLSVTPIVSTNRMGATIDVRF